MREAAACAAISANLHRLLAERKMSVYKLSLATGDYENTIASTVHGRNVPTATRLHRIAKVLGVTMDSLMEPTT